MTTPVVFISYSHQDESWKDRLVKHLKVLQMEDIIEVWEDRRIGAGENWYQEIQNAMNESKVGIMLVSVDFLTSEFILGDEVPQLLKLRAKEGVKIYPVIIKPCPWKNVKWLSEMNLRPKDGRAISGGDDYHIDTDLAAIAEEIASIIQPIGKEKPTPNPVYSSSELPAYSPQLKDFVTHNRADEITKALTYLED
ncbi:MAG TPA: toll/interleukin-1 receptor domain-containing protein, partial [Candidatus Methanoperedens sp.]